MGITAIICNPICGDTEPDSTTNGQYTDFGRPLIERSPTANDGEMDAWINRVIAQFKECVLSRAEDKAIALVDQYHAIDLIFVKFPDGFNCLQMAVKKELPKLVLFLLEEGHSVKFIAHCYVHTL